MMKGFLKISKLMGLMLLASGLLFAGCVGPGGDSESAVAGNGGFMIPVTMDMTSQTMTIGDGVGMAVGDWEGHQVGLQNVGSCSGLATAATCTVRVTNLDPNYYMANTYIALSYCADCAGDKLFSNADLSNGVTVFVSGDATGAGGAADINGAAYCVVEDGLYTNDGYPAPFNATGCVTVSTKGDPKPLQFIHPDCGTRDVRWDFDTLTGDNFRFYANIAAQWFPEIPTGDSRFDFENRTTYYLTLQKLDDKIAGALNKTWWRIGSYKRSTTLTGWGSGGADFTPADPAVGGRVYFALNVLLDYPDRIEKYTGVGYPTIGDGFSDYEYYTSISWIVRYDPTVIKNVAVTGLTGKGGTTLYSGGLDLCDRNASSAHCDKRKPTFTGMDPVQVVVGGAAEANGWLFSYTPIIQQVFTWNAPGASYQTTNGGKVYAGYGNLWPVHAGQIGLAKVNMVVATPTYPLTNWYLSTAFIPNSGTPDADPELGLGMYYFKLQAGTSGRGTQLYTDHWSTENGPLINWTNGTPAGGFFGGGSDDWIMPCIPIDPAYANNVDQGCNPGKTIADYYVYGNTESSNPLIRHSGLSVPNRGAFQYWNVHLCVL